MAAAVMNNAHNHLPPSVQANSPTRSLRHQASDASLSSQAPPDSGRSYVEWVRGWKDEQVATWLAENKCGAYETVFRDNDIRGDVLLDVDQQALKEMGVHSVGDRIKITVAIKKLRSACVAAGVRKTASSSRLSTASTSSAQTGTRGGKAIPPPLHLNSSSSTSSKLGQAYQAGVTAPVAAVHHAHSNSGGQHSAGSTSSLLSAPATASSNHLSSPNAASSHVRRGSSPRHQPGPPAAPAPRSGLPAPPGSVEGSPSSTRDRTPHSSFHPPAITSTPPSATVPVERWQAGEYGLPRAPASQRGPTGKFSTGPGSSSSSSGGNWNGSVPALSLSKAGQIAQSHRKTGSVTTTGTPPMHTSHSSRPSTAGSSSVSGGHHALLSQHPYATATSPTADAFGSTSSYYGHSRPGTAPSSLSLAPAPALGGPNSLSPITEMNSPVPSPLTSEPPVRPSTGLASSQSGGFTVGKGGFARPSTPAGTVAVGSQGLMQTPSAHPPLEDLMRRTVRFSGPDESGSKMVNVDGAKDAPEVLARVLRRFKLSGVDGARTETATERGELVTEIDGWAVFASAADGQGARVLPDSELIAICTLMSRPERQKGLTIRKVHHQRKQQYGVAGDHPYAPHARMTSASSSGRDHSPTSPGYGLDVRVPATSVEPASPTPSSPDSSSDRDHIRPSHNPMNRASTVSVMSGLLDWGQVGGPVAPMPVPSASVGQERSSFMGAGPRKLRNFFGHRPPSELISSHLADYFPSAEKKLLRRSMASRRSVAMAGGGMRPQSQWSNESARMSWADGGNVGAMPSRFSMSSVGSTESSNHLLSAPPPAPPVPAKDHYAPMPLNDDRASIDLLRRASALLSPSSEEPSTSSASSTSGIGDRRSRLSVYSTTTQGSKRDSDTASLLTVDEITAEVEHRRLSMASSWASGGEGEETALTDEEDETATSMRPKSIRRPSTLPPSSEADEESSDEDDEDDEDDEETDATDGAPEKVTSSGDRSQIKWIKGAVIGTGSFGVVSLGMVATTGTLMAVKQVELPTGNSANEERKKSMLTALQREIELLKTLQHPNIVQYLDSSSDGSHLNIFLEYVPGGSIAALLQNYGAFEEALVSNFVRQILTGLNYLHERDIVHRDIKGANILVDNKGGVKISDFGISKKVEDNLLSTARSHRPSLQGSVFWMSPEVVKQLPYTSKADIWSIGSVVLEMLTGSHPYPNLTQMQALFRIGSSKAPSPEIPTDISPDAQHFLAQTFLTNHTERPSAADLLAHAFIKEKVDPAQTPTTSTFSHDRSIPRETTVMS